MRVLHTADFHAGRNLRGYDRTPEIREALTEIAGLARSEKVDAVLVAGDLFDTVNPPADAEAAIFAFFLPCATPGFPASSSPETTTAARGWAASAACSAGWGCRWWPSPAPTPGRC